MKLGAPSDRSPGALTRLAAAALLATTACGGADAGGTPVPTGDWRGDIETPADPAAAFGATWHVARSDGSSGLQLSVSTPSRGRVGPVPLEAVGDTLRFALPWNRSAVCDTARRDDGSWRGSCPLPGDDGSVHLVLVPPGRDLPVGAARTGVERIEGDWRRTEAGPVIVYTRPGTEAHRHRAAVVRHARAAVKRAVELLDADGWEGPVRLVYLENPEEMERASSRRVRGGWADPGGNAALLITYEGGATDVVHEVIHVVSIRQWGPAARPGAWLQEGLAEWGDGGHCGQVPHGRLDRYLHERGDGLSVISLAEEFWQHDDRVTMPQATTLVGYLVDAHGLEAVRGLWERGIDETEAVLGYGPVELERRWRAWVRERYRPASETEWSGTMGGEQGCPREKPPDPRSTSLDNTS